MYGSVINLRRGNDVTLTATLMDKNHDPVALTNVTEIVFTVKDDLDGDITFQKKLSASQITKTDSPNGIYEISILYSDTKDLGASKEKFGESGERYTKYYYDIKITISGEVKTVAFNCIKLFDVVNPD